MAKNLASFVQAAIGVSLISIGLITGNPQFVTAGGGFLFAGAVTYAAGSLFKTKTEDPVANSPAYGFRQWQNPIKGDAPVPVIYSAAGHKHAPAYVAATISPGGSHSTDSAKVLNQTDQGMSALLVVGEGPMRGIEDVRVNDEPMLEEFTETFKGDGSKRTFTFGKKRIVVDTLSIVDNGVDRGYSLTPHAFTKITGKGLVVQTTFTVDDDIATERDLSVKVNGTEVDLTSTTNLRPRVWLSDPKTLRVYSQTVVPLGTTIEITAQKRVMTGVAVKRTSDGDLAIKFDTAPASGTKVVVTGLRRIFKGISVDTRLGGAHQLSIPEFSDIRNTYGDGTAIGTAGNEVTITTRDEVDDVILNIASVNGFTSFTKLGNRQGTYAQFKVEYRGADSAGAFAGEWVPLMDPEGKGTSKLNGFNVKKNANEFEIHGDSLSPMYWTFSTLRILRKLARQHPKVSSHQKRLANFNRNRYQFRLTRTSSVKSTNALFQDDIELGSYTEVIDEFLNYPGTAMLAVSAIASSRLQGSAPRITCKAKGISDVQKWTGTAWTTDEDAQSNPVWAAIDLITKARYGGGEQYTLANIDTTTALAAATYCDASETLPGNATEARAVLSVPLDARRGLLSTVADMLRAASIWPVMQGDTWRFVIDQGVTLADVPVLWEDTISSRTTDAQLGHGTVSAEPTEVQVAFLDEDKDWDQKEVWVTPGTPAASRRIQRVQAFGATRRTQITRYGNRVYTQAGSGGMSLRLRASPKYIDMEAGDVFRYRSNRLGIDAYWRVFRILWGNDEPLLKIEAIPYVLAVYGQQEAVQSTDKSSATTESSRAVPAIVSRPRSPTGPTLPGARRPKRAKMAIAAKRVT